MVRRRLPAAGGAVPLLLATAGTLLVAFALKSGCLSHWRPGHQPSACYNDLQTLWYSRRLGVHAFPYHGSVTTVHASGRPTFVRLGPGEIEYPVLTGVFAWLTALPVGGPNRFLIGSALALSPFALLTSVALRAVAGRRAWLFALSPLLAAFAFLNWDLLPVAAVATALWAWRRDRIGLAGVLLGLGFGAKIWPGFVVLPLALDLLFAHRRRAAVRFGGAALATALVVNLPFALTDPTGWFAPYLKQSTRLNDRTTNSIWFRLADPHPAAAVDLWSTVAVLLAWAALFGAANLRRRRQGCWPAIGLAAAMVSSYMLLGRVDSPQYGLWLLPFLVALAVPVPWLLAYLTADLWLWLEWSWWSGSPRWKEDAAVACWVALAALTVAFLRAREVSSQPDVGAPDAGHPDAGDPDAAPDAETVVELPPEPVRSAPQVKA